MNFESFLNEEIITEKLLDSKLRQFNIVAKMFYNSDLIKFVKNLSEETGFDLDKQYEKVNESLLDFIYELDSSGASLKNKG